MPGARSPSSPSDGRRSSSRTPTRTRAWFVVIEGGGFVRVGEETARVFAGEAVLWPAGILHGASTDLSEMRAIVVEFAGADDAAVQGIVDGVALALEAGPVEPGEGALAGDPPGHAYDPSHGEPR